MGQRASGHKRGKSASGSVQERRPLTGMSGQSASARNSRSAEFAPDRHPDGPGPEARFALANRAGRREVAQNMTDLTSLPLMLGGEPAITGFLIVHLERGDFIRTTIDRIGIIRIEDDNIEALLSELAFVDDCIITRVAE